jgi:hypothetical protein
VNTLAALLLALLKAVPALESLVAAALNERARAREAEALKRKQTKDAAVDEAIDAPILNKTPRTP